MKLKDILGDAKVADQKMNKELRTASDFADYVDKLVAKAKAADKDAAPVGGAKSFKDAITSQGKELWLWWDSLDKSTHIASMKVESKHRRRFHETA